MKVLILNGSPRVGGNTTVAVEEMERIFREEGVEVETVQVGARDIRGCIACGRCAETGRCVFDDIVNELAPKLEAADGLVEFRSANGFFGGALRLILGFALIMAIRIGLKALLPDMMWCHTLRYGLMGLFGTFLWPWVFTKLGF